MRTVPKQKDQLLPIGARVPATVLLRVCVSTIERTSSSTLFTVCSADLSSHRGPTAAPAVDR